MRTRARHHGKGVEQSVKAVSTGAKSYSLLALNTSVVHKCAAAHKRGTLWPSAVSARQRRSRARRARSPSGHRTPRSRMP
jgi:hypothetical protein